MITTPPPPPPPPPTSPYAASFLTCLHVSKTGCIKSITSYNSQFRVSCNVCMGRNFHICYMYMKISYKVNIVHANINLNCCCILSNSLVPESPLKWRCAILLFQCNSIHFNVRTVLIFIDAVSYTCLLIDNFRMLLNKYASVNCSVRWS